MPRAVSRALDGWLRRQSAVAKRPLRLAILLGATGGLLLVPEAWSLAHAVTAVIFHGQPLRAVLPSLGLLLGLALLGLRRRKR